MPALEIHPATPDRWSDVKRLFGAKGACAGCWCMYSRRTNAQWEAGKGDGNRRALKRLVDRGAVPGVLGYLDDTPVAWCSLAPRPGFPRLERSRVMRAIDDAPVWSVVCLFVHRDHRGTGCSVAMLRGAAHYAFSRGAEIVEGYPIEPKKQPMPAAFAWWGTASAFAQAGFTEVARGSKTRPIMRLAAP